MGRLGGTAADWVRMAIEVVRVVDGRTGEVYAGPGNRHWVHGASVVPRFAACGAGITGAVLTKGACTEISCDECATLYAADYMVTSA